MTNPVVITSDTPCDIPASLLERYDIKTIPLWITVGDRTFRDGVDITPDDIFMYYDHDGVLPKTAAVTPGEYYEFFKRFTDSGYDVVHLNLSSKISATYQNAMMAASSLKGVYPVDSLSLCTGIALLVIKACEMRDSGMEAQEIAGLLPAMREKVHTSFILDKLEFLYKGGRCSMLTAVGANLLGIKPCIEMKSGELLVGKKYRGKLQNCYEQYAREKISNEKNLDLDRVFIAHSGVSKEAIDGVAKVIRQYADFKEILVARAGCTISSHCGKDTLAVIYMTT